MLQLLDLCLRLDATEVELSADMQEEAMLRLLLDVRAMCVGAARNHVPFYR